MPGFQKSHFAHALNTILEETSMSVQDVVSEMNKQDIPLPLHTFNYWLQGYFLPRSTSAFQVIDTLEKILNISDNCLSDALLRDLSSENSFVPGGNLEYSFVVSAPKVSSNRESHFQGFDKQVDWQADVLRKVIREKVYADADLRHFQQEVTIMANVPRVPNPSLAISILFDESEGACPKDGNYIYDVCGAQLKEQETYDEDRQHIFGARLYLPDTAMPGQLHQISYKWDWEIVAQQSSFKIAERFLPWELDFYSSSITFEGGIPEDIRYVTYKFVEKKDIEVPNDIPLIRDGNTVSVSVKNFGNIVGFFEAGTEKVE